MKYITLLLSLLILFTSCLTPKEPVPEEEPVVVVVEPEPEPEPVVVPEPEPEPVVEPEPEVYVATEEEYDRTFEEVEILIADLNKIISIGNYVEWQSYLSESYISTYGDKTFLEELSDNPVLKDYGIKLKKLRDYFTYVVQPSRSNVVVDEIQFVTEDKIKVFTYINNKPRILYTLIRVEESWIITE